MPLKKKINSAVFGNETAIHIDFRRMILSHYQWYIDHIDGQYYPFTVRVGINVPELFLTLT